METGRGRTGERGATGWGQGRAGRLAWRGAAQGRGGSGHRGGGGGGHRGGGRRGGTGVFFLKKIYTSQNCLGGTREIQPALRGLRGARMGWPKRAWRRVCKGI